MFNFTSRKARHRIHRINSLIIIIFFLQFKQSLLSLFTEKHKSLVVSVTKKIIRTIFSSEKTWILSKRDVNLKKKKKKFCLFKNSVH